MPRITNEPESIDDRPIVSRPARIEADWSRFEPWRVLPVRHTLDEHRLLQLHSLIELGERLAARGGVIRTHTDAARAETPFNEAPRRHPNPRSAMETLSAIRDAKAWMSLGDVQADPEYRKLIGEVLESAHPHVDRLDPGMCGRAGWIFVSSPHAVTPFHFDKEHNFILQVAGRKRVYVWEPDDMVVATELARDRFHHRHERDLLRWREEYRERAHVFDLSPGQGAYMPSTSPHMVENGGEPSITMSFTYYTDATRRNAFLHKAHALMRQCGLVPPAVGQREWFDALTASCIQMTIMGQRMLRRLAGKQRTGSPAPYSPVGGQV